MESFLSFLESASNIIKNAKTSLSTSPMNSVKGTIESKIDVVKTKIEETILDTYDNPLQDTTGSLEDKISPERLQEVKDIFGESIRYDEVIVNNSSLMVDVNSNFNDSGKSRPFVLGNVINTEGEINPRTFIHEMVHVYQYNKYGWESTPIAFEAALKGEYDYEYSKLERIANDSSFDGNKLEQFGFEEQAEIVADYYTLTQFNTGDSVKLATGEMITDANIDTVKQVYEPYIQEIQNSQPREGWQKEIDETGQEVIREFGEGGEEIFKEIKEGDKSGVIYETGETAVEATREVAEGVIETGYEAGKERYEAGKDALEKGFETGKDAFEHGYDAVENGKEAITDGFETGANLFDGLFDS